MTWHIVWRTCVARNLVADSQLYEQIRSRLIGAHQAPGRVLLHYLVTPTEMHLLSSLPKGEEPEKVARRIANVVARFVHLSDGVPGFVFAARYEARRIDKGEPEWNEFRMLAWRPVALGLCRAMSYYPFSSLRATLGLQRRDGFDVAAALRVPDGMVLKARTLLRARIAKRPTEIEVREWELSRHLVLATGSVGPSSAMARLVGGAAAALVAGSDPQDIDGALHLLENWVLLKLDMRDVVDLVDVPKPVAARVRALIACLAMGMGLCSASSVARYFQRAKATLSEQMAICRGRPEDQEILSVPGFRVVEEAIAIRRRL